VIIAVIGRFLEASMSDASASPEEVYDEEQVDIDGGVDLDEEVDDASADHEDEEEDEEEKAQGLDLDVDGEAQEGEDGHEDQDIDVLNGDHDHQTIEVEFATEETDAHVEGDDAIVEDKEGKDAEKSGELLKRPPHGSEIFVGGITRDTTEEDLRTLCSSCGDIYEVCGILDMLLRKSEIPHAILS
jgi:heterogeneous nuclear ribonucleoprotein R